MFVLTCWSASLLGKADCYYQMHGQASAAGALPVLHDAGNLRIIHQLRAAAMPVLIKR
jgi:hypothetical protein